MDKKIDKLQKKLVNENHSIYSSPTNGSNPMIRARLIAMVSLRWFFAPVPVTRRGKILPRSEMKRFSNSISL